MRTARRDSGEARIAGPVLAADGGQERAQLPLFVEQRHDEPTSVAGAVVVGERIGRVFAGRPVRYGLAVQPGVHEAGVGPQAVGQQRRRDQAAAAGLLASIQGRDDRGVQAGGAGMVAHAGSGTGGHRIGVGAHRVHQPGAGPIGGGVEAGFGGFGAGFTVGGERGVDQPRIERQQVGWRQVQAVAHRQREVGDEDVGGRGEAVEYGAALVVLQVQCQAALVARGQLPVVVDFRVWVGAAGAPGVAGAGWLDLDHVGAEVGQDRGCGGAGDPACAVDDFQAGEQVVWHFVPLSVGSFRYREGRA